MEPISNLQRDGSYKSGLLVAKNTGGCSEPVENTTWNEINKFASSEATVHFSFPYFL